MSNNYHIHIYVTNGLFEYDIKAETEEKALEEALEKATQALDDGNAPLKSDAKFVALIPNQEKK